MYRIIKTTWSYLYYDEIFFPIKGSDENMIRLGYVKCMFSDNNTNTNMNKNLNDCSKLIIDWQDIIGIKFGYWWKLDNNPVIV